MLYNFLLYARLLRVKQWTKNLLVFLPLMLHKEFSNIHLLTFSIIGFFSFSMMASCCYILNDIRDVEYDRMHWRKKDRPIASGKIPVLNAFTTAILLFVLSVCASAMLGKYALAFLGLYFLLNWLYSGPVKKIKYVDIVVLSLFYLLRLFYAWGITQIMLTGLFILTCSLLFLAASAHKRYMECVQSKEKAIAGRGYSASDAGAMRMLTFFFAALAMASFNIHATMVLNIRSVLWIALLNALTLLVFYFFFETRNNNYDDPIDRILKKPLLLILSVVFAALYIFLVVTRL